MNQNEISKLIEKARKDKGLTQNQLAEKLGVSNTAISKWENGYNLPDISMFEPLSEILDIDMYNLINTQTNLLEDSGRKISKIKRVKIRRNLITILIIIISLITTNFLTYFYTNKSANEIKSSPVEVYKITSKDKDFKVDGYIIFNDEESIVIINKIYYQGTESDKSCQIIKLTLNVVDSTLLIKAAQSSDNKNENINNLLKDILINKEQSNSDLQKLKPNFNNAYLELRMQKKNGDSDKIKVNLSLKRIVT